MVVGVNSQYHLPVENAKVERASVESVTEFPAVWRFPFESVK
jgi:hypothetical protein